MNMTMVKLPLGNDSSSMTSGESRNTIDNSGIGDTLLGRHVNKKIDHSASCITKHPTNTKEFEVSAPRVDSSCCSSTADICQESLESSPVSTIQSAPSPCTHNANEEQDVSSDPNKPQSTSESSAVVTKKPDTETCRHDGAALLKKAVQEQSKKPGKEKESEQENEGKAMTSSKLSDTNDGSIENDKCTKTKTSSCKLPSSSCKFQNSSSPRFVFNHKAPPSSSSSSSSSSTTGSTSLVSSPSTQKRQIEHKKSISTNFVTPSPSPPHRSMIKPAKMKTSAHCADKQNTCVAGKRNSLAEKLDSGAAKQDTNATKEDSNASKENSNASKENSNGSKENSNVSKVDSSASKEPSNASKEPSNASKEHSNSPKQEAVADEKSCVADKTDSATDEPNSSPEKQDSVEEEQKIPAGKQIAAAEAGKTVFYHDTTSRMEGTANCDTATDSEESKQQLRQSNNSSPNSCNATNSSSKAQSDAPASGPLVVALSTSSFCNAAIKGKSNEDKEKATENDKTKLRGIQATDTGGHNPNAITPTMTTRSRNEAHKKKTNKNQQKKVNFKEDVDVTIFCVNNESLRSTKDISAHNQKPSEQRTRSGLSCKEFAHASAEQRKNLSVANHSASKKTDNNGNNSTKSTEEKVARFNIGPGDSETRDSEQSCPTKATAYDDALSRAEKEIQMLRRSVRVLATEKMALLRKMEMMRLEQQLWKREIKKELQLVANLNRTRVHPTDYENSVLCQPLKRMKLLHPCGDQSDYNHININEVVVEQKARAQTSSRDFMPREKISDSDDESVENEDGKESEQLNSKVQPSETSPASLEQDTLLCDEDSLQEQDSELYEEDSVPEQDTIQSHPAGQYRHQGFTQDHRSYDPPKQQTRQSDRPRKPTRKLFELQHEQPEKRRKPSQHHFTQSYPQRYPHATHQNAPQMWDRQHHIANDKNLILQESSAKEKLKRRLPKQKQPHRMETMAHQKRMTQGQKLHLRTERA